MFTGRRILSRHEEAAMYRTLNVGLMAGTAILLLSVQPALAQDDHLAQAVDHAQQAVSNVMVELEIAVA